MKGWGKIFQANGTRKQTGVTTFISTKADFKPILVTRDKEGHFILRREIIHQVITIINIYVPNITLNFIKQTQLDIKAQINHNIMIVLILYPILTNK
jgi:hypothetical protein